MATIISVAVMIVTLALVNGFQEAVSQKVFSFLGHVRVQQRQPGQGNISEELPVQRNVRLETIVKGLPGVHSIHPFATRYSILRANAEIEGVMFKGLDKTYDTSHILPFMQEGRFIRFSDSTYSREIMISTQIARQLQLKLNDQPIIYFIKPDGSIRPDKLRVVGIYKTGIEEYDKSFALGDLALVSRLNEWSPGQIGGYEIFINDHRQMGILSEEIYALGAFPQEWDARPVTDIYPEIFDWLGILDQNRNILIIVMAAVALINLVTCLIILVLERLRMIGILKSLGASNWMVQKVFLLQSAIITVTGIMIGTALALAILWIQQRTGIVRLQEESYYLDSAAVKIIWWQVGLVVGGTLLVSLLVLMIPSFIVRRVQPVKAIRFQ